MRSPSYLCLSGFISGLAFSHPSPEAEPQHGGFGSPFDKVAVMDSEDDGGPRFDDGLVQNLTAIRGRDIDLTCKVYNLGNKTVRSVALLLSLPYKLDLDSTWPPFEIFWQIYCPKRRGSCSGGPQKVRR